MDNKARAGILLVQIDLDGKGTVERSLRLKDALNEAEQRGMHRFKMWGTDDCINNEGHGMAIGPDMCLGRVSLYYLDNKKCIECQHKKERENESRCKTESKGAQ